MRRRARWILLATVLTLYGVVTIGGPALHALPGFGHGAATLASHARNVPAQPDRDGKAPHDCPICHFHAQGQLDVAALGDLLVDVVRIRPASPSPLVFPPALDRPSSPRAPPLG
jgi:hypothetical protein